MLYCLQREGFPPPRGRKPDRLQAVLLATKQHGVKHMKRLTISRMASARLKTERKSYLSLAIGVFLSLFLVSTMCLIVQGLYLQQHRETVARVGDIQCMHLDGGDTDEQVFIDSGLFDRIGHVYISGGVSSTNFYLGWYDQAGQDIAKRRALEGRMPTQAGEIAMEQSAVDALCPDTNIGDTVELAITPFSGTEEKRAFTLVGILTDQSTYLRRQNGYWITSYLADFPQVLMSEEEPEFATGSMKMHRIMKMASGHTMAEALIWGYGKHFPGAVCGMSDTGVFIDYYGDPASLLKIDDKLLVMYIMGGLLFFALCCACCTGIAGAMEGLLAHRREEIGILRAVGATRRQIRRIFGRESLLLALILTPISVACACGVAAVMAALMPEQFVFRANPVLLVPILLLGMLVVAMASYLPLRRASKIMPMSVLRDTEMLRRNSHIRRRRSSKSFSVPRLIATRQLRAHPTRQLGASTMVLLMLFCIMAFGEFMSYGVSSLEGDEPHFTISSPFGASYTYLHFYRYNSRELSQQDLAQIMRLPHVRKVETEHTALATLVMDERNSYLDDHAYTSGGPFQVSGLSEEEFKDILRRSNMEMDEESLENWYQNYSKDEKELEKIMASVNLEDKMLYGLDLSTIELDEKTLKALEKYVIDGKIDPEAIAAGREVIAYTPDIWYWETKNADGSIMKNMETHDERPNNLAELAVHNDGDIVAGQTLHITQFYNITKGDGAETYENFNLMDYQRGDCEVKVGAVVTGIEGVRSVGGGFGDLTVLTTEEGYKRMPFYSGGVYVRIYLDGPVDEATEEYLERRITAIASRQTDASVYNNQKRAEEVNQQRQQMMLLFASIAIIFFTVAVSMIVSGVSRNIQADGRLIGMLRAVGADERTIRACYQGQVVFSVVMGTVLFGIIYAICWVARGGRYWTVLSGFTNRGLIVLLAVCLGFAMLCLLLCLMMLRARVRQTTRRSIVETIKEM